MIRNFFIALIVFGGICLASVLFLFVITLAQRGEGSLANHRYKEIWILEKNGDIIGGTIVGDCWDFTSLKTNIQYRGCVNKRNVNMELKELMKAVPPFLHRGKDERLLGL